MSGVSTSDPVKQLLTILADPAAFKKQLADFSAAKEAADASGVKLSQIRDNLDREVSKHQATVDAHNAWVADFQATKNRVLETDAKLADREAAVAKAEADLANDSKVHAQAVETFENDAAARSKALDSREKKVAKLESDLVELQIKLATREKSLTDKLARLQELAG